MYMAEGSERSSLSRLTVIIPTISRPDFVRRQIKYWLQTDAEVRILDGASVPMDLKEFALTETNVRYIHMPANFNERIANASQLIDTEFSCVLGDDEFFVPSGLKECIRHLDNHPDDIGCVGKVLYFFIEQGKFLAFQGYMDWQNFTDDAVTATDRVKQILPPHKTHMAYCGIYRSECWKKIFETSYCDYYSSGYLYERMLNLYRAVLGRTVILNNLLWMRSMENPPISDDAVPRSDGGLVGWAENPANRSELLHYRNKVRSILASGVGISSAEVEEFTDRFVFGGIERQRAKDARGRRPMVRIRFAVVKYSPKSLKLIAKRFAPRFILRQLDWNGYPLKRIMRDLRRQHIGFDVNDLRRIETLALETHALQRSRQTKPIRI
jgi:glycosyltransferase domain-containing protein